MKKLLTGIMAISMMTVIAPAFAEDGDRSERREKFKAKLEECKADSSAHKRCDKILERAEKFKGKMKKHMKEIDTNNDGKISKSEFLAHKGKRFDKMDSNNDGYLSKEEAKAGRKAMKAKRHERKANRDSE